VQTENLPYQAWLHWSLTNSCNFNCDYCFGFDHHSGFVPQHVDISAVMQSLEKSGLIFRIGFTGNGEPFLIPNFVELCSAIAQKHYLTINTNLTNPRIAEFANQPGLKEKVLTIFASVHFFELSDKNLWNRFLENYRLLQSSGFQIKLTAVGWPGFIRKIEKELAVVRKIGAAVEFEPFFGSFASKKYPENYTAEELTYFGLTAESYAKFNQKGKICNAGYNTGIITPTGKIKSCFQENIVLGSIYTGFRFQTEMLNCRHKICGCPLNVYDAGLFELAKKHTLIN